MGGEQDDHFFFFTSVVACTIYAARWGPSLRLMTGSAMVTLRQQTNQPVCLGGRHPIIIYKKYTRTRRAKPLIFADVHPLVRHDFSSPTRKAGDLIYSRRPTHLPPLQTTTRNSKRHIFSTRTARGPTKFKIILLCTSLLYREG